MTLRVSLAVFVILSSVVSRSQAQNPRQPPKLGTVHFATSCSSTAQPIFTRAVALLHSFEFRQAIAGFNATLRADSTCGIAYWGIALSAWGNPFAPGIKPAKQIEAGLAAVQRGRATGSRTPRERDYVAAISMLYDGAEAIDQPTRVIVYRDVMSGLAARYPDDTEASIFYALALAGSADPTDKTYASQLKAGAILEGLARKYPDHPGLAHYIIHTYDFPSLASRALKAAVSYSTIAPSLPHALHMPSHTYTRVGDWQESIDGNLASKVAARRELSGAEELHASDYMMYAYLQTGQDRAARALLATIPQMVTRFDPTKPASAAPPSAGYFAIAAMPARYALERGAWQDAARLDFKESPFPFADAITHFARALGAARIGDTATALSAIRMLQRNRDDLMGLNEKYWAEQTEIQVRGALAWHALAHGNKVGALERMRDAAEREDATDKSALTPGPIAPARELLGEMLLELNQPAAALKEFERTLKVEPRRFRTVAGAAKAAAAAGDRATARKYYEQLLKIAARGDKPGRAELITARRMAVR
jgi:tetratricopeptide (TPR) repeat protein